MWEVWYGLEAANYLNDKGTLVTDLFSPSKRWQKSLTGHKWAKFNKSMN